MYSQQITWNPQEGWTPVKAEPEKVSLVFYFGTRQMLACGKRYHELREMFPAAHILGCSTGGQISNSDISDDEIVAAAISLDATRLQLVRQDISDALQSRNCGETIGRALQREDLAGIFVLSDGLNVNGSELVAGLTSVVSPKVPLTGGLAGDSTGGTGTRDVTVHVLTIRRSWSRASSLAILRSDIRAAPPCWERRLKGHTLKFSRPFRAS